MRSLLLAEASAVAQNPSVPQWVATVILFAALAAVIGIFVFFLRYLRKNKSRTGRY